MSRRAQGEALVVGPGKTVGAETFTCKHCNRVVLLHDLKTGNRTAEQGVMCTMCMRPVCVQCAERAVCDPFEKKLERSEARGRLLAAMGIP